HGEAAIATILAKGQLLRPLDMGPTIVLMGRATINMAFMDTLGVTMVCSSIGMSANYGTQLDTLRVTMELFDLVDFIFVASGNKYAINIDQKSKKRVVPARAVNELNVQRIVRRSFGGKLVYVRLFNK
ncbi:hypothetical protein Tco_1520302, partial [Tanacetum coccineum]